MKLFKKIGDNLKQMMEEAKEGRAITKEENKEVRAIERKAYHEERIVVAVKDGKARANKPKGIAAFADGMKNISKTIDKLAPPKKKGKGKQPNIMDVMTGTKEKNGKTMMDMRFI